MSLTRRGFCASGFGAMATMLGSSRQNDPRPNIVVVLADDLGYGDPSCYWDIHRRENGNKKYETPNIDALAASGVRFTSCYAATSVCSPSRAALFTGEMPIKTGVINILEENSVEALSPSVITIPQVLGPGYRRGFFGKWHKGYAKNLNNFPLAKGFDEADWIPYSANMNPLPHLIGNGIKEENVGQRGSLSKTFTDAACKFIKENKDTPFFLQMSFPIPHYPWEAPDKFRTATDSLYGNAVAELDFRVGQIVEAVSSTETLENTLIVFTSDNGPMQGYGSTGPFQGFKFGLGEGGLRVPGIVSWLRKIKAGQVCHARVSHMDILPTLAHAANVGLSKKVDGIDLGPMLWEGKAWSESEVAARLIPYSSGRYIPAVRWREWKLVVLENGARLAQPKLYNLRERPDESLDVSYGHPDVVKKILEMYEKLIGTFLPGEVN